MKENVSGCFFLNTVYILRNFHTVHLFIQQNSLQSEQHYSTSVNFLLKHSLFLQTLFLLYNRPRNRSSRSIESIVWGRSRVELREGPKVESTDRVNRLTVELSWGNGSRLSQFVTPRMTYWIQHWWNGQNIRWYVRITRTLADCRQCRDHNYSVVIN